jgi:hypothetical protein
MENYTDPHEVGKKICDITGVDIFSSSREKKYVELRALVCHTLKEDLRLDYQRIADYFNSKGKEMGRCNARHATLMYQVYKKDNKNLELLEGSFNFASSIEKNKKLNLQDKLSNLQHRHDKLKKELENPIIKMLHNIPEEKWGEVQERIQLLKNSWGWKMKNNYEIIESY